MRRILAALTRIGLGPDPVHRHVQRLVRLGRQRPQRHPRRHEPLADRGDAFHLVDGHGLAQGLDGEQVAQMHRRHRLHLGRILLPHLEGGARHRRLQHVHRGRFPGMGLPRPARLVEAADGQNIAPALPAKGMNPLDLLLDAGQADAGNPALHPGEIVRHHRAAQPHRLEVQAPPVGGDDRDPHLRHDLEKPRVDGLAVAPHGVGQRAVDQPLLDPVGDGILGQIGVHHRRPAADQHREVMRVDAFGRPHVERTEGPQPLPRQPRYAPPRSPGSSAAAPCPRSDGGPSAQYAPRPSARHPRPRCGCGSVRLAQRARHPTRPRRCSRSRPWAR
jgi:hypothetical protein